MKKNFFKKKLASGLALALVVASLSPAGVSAATATKIVKQGGAAAPTVLYVGDKGTDYSLSKTYKTNTYNWKISNSKLATINAKTGVVTAKAPGTVTIRVTARNAKTNKWLKDFTMKLYIKQRADKVDIGSDDFTLGAGEVKDLNAVKTPKTSTDVIVYASSDEKVATVNATTGVVKAVAPGEATITVYSKGLKSSPITSKYNRTDSVKVTVAFGVSEVKQTAHNELALTFNGDAKDVKATDISIVKESTKQVFAVNTVKADGTKLTVTTFASLNDGSVYTLTYGGKSLNFTATDNVVADLTFNKVTVPYETQTAITVSTVDAKGVVLGTYGLDEDEAKIDFEVTTDQGYITDNKLVLFKIGDTAKATATYHTFKYDDAGNEVGAITRTATITAIDQTAVTIASVEYTIATEKPNWDKFTASTRLAVNDDAYSIYLNIKKSDKSTVDPTEAALYSFESSNNDVLLVNSNADLSAGLVAVSQGTAYVLVKKDNKVVYNLLVNIVAERKTTSLELGATSVTLSNAETANDTKDVSVVIKDQYGDVKSKTEVASVEVLSVPSGIAKIDVQNNDAYYETLAGKVTFKGEVAVGTYVYKLTVDKVSKTVAVTVKAPVDAATASYGFEITNKTVDTAFASADDLKNVTIKVPVTKGGVLVKYLDLESLPDEDIVVKKGTDVITDYTVSGSTITFKAVSADADKVVTKAAAGSYSVSIKFEHMTTGKVSTITNGFVVNDTQAGVTVARKATTASVTGTFEDLILSEKSNVVNSVFKFTYKGTDITPEVTAVSYKELGKTVSISKVTVLVEIEGYKVPVEVTINGSFTY